MISKLRGLYNNWLPQSVNTKVFFSMILVGGFTICSKLFAMLKDLVVANQFGTADELDAFFVAFMIPSFVINVVAGSLSSAFIPTYIELREREGLKKAQYLFSNVMFLVCSFLIIFAFLLAFYGKNLLSYMGSGFSSEKLALASSLYILMLPMILINGLNTIWSSVLNANDRFGLTSSTPMITPIFMTVVLLIGARYFGIYALALGVVIGSILEAVLLARAIRNQKLCLVPKWHGMDLTTKQVFKQYTPMLAGAFIMSSTTLIDQSMAAMLGPGSVSSLNYGNKIVSLIIGVGTIVIGSVVLPHFSRLVAADDRNGLFNTFKLHMRLVLLLTIPVTLFIVLFSELLISVLFERGSFQPKDTIIISRIQALYALQIPFNLLGIIVVRLISALKANIILMYGAAINLILNIFLNLIFMRWLGASGIALSTSFVYFISFIFCMLMLYWKFGEKSRKNSTGKSEL